MKLRRTLVRKNVSLLRQGARLVEQLDDELYVCAHGALSRSGVGGHIRHLVESYECLLGGLAEGTPIDYDARPRDERVESDPAHARERILGLVDALQALDQVDAGGAALSVRMETPELLAAVGSASTSSLERELAFLLSHTVHHFALIAILLRLAGHEPPVDLGVAPSTLAHQEESGSCAP